MQNKKLYDFSIKAIPEGVFIDPRMQNDLRKVENLINKKQISSKYEDIWLTLKMNPLLTK